MKTRIIRGTSTYCVITDDGYFLDQVIEPGMSVECSLLLSAAEYREEAARLLKYADRCEKAAAMFGRQTDVKEAQA